MRGGLRGRSLDHWPSHMEPMTSCHRCCARSNVSAARWTPQHSIPIALPPHDRVTGSVRSPIAPVSGNRRQRTDFELCRKNTRFSSAAADIGESKRPSVGAIVHAFTGLIVGAGFVLVPHIVEVGVAVTGIKGGDVVVFGIAVGAEILAVLDAQCARSLHIF